MIFVQLAPKMDLLPETDLDMEDILGNSFCEVRPNDIGNGSNFVLQTTLLNSPGSHRDCHHECPCTE